MRGLDGRVVIVTGGGGGIGGATVRRFAEEGAKVAVFGFGSFETAGMQSKGCSVANQTPKKPQNTAKQQNNP